MGKTELTRDGEFIVGEDKVLDIILAFLFFAIFVYGLVDAVKHHFSQLKYLDYVFFVALLPAIRFLLKARAKRIYIRINITGIYQDEKLVTAWPNFLKAYISQSDKVLTIQDNFLLVVEYMKDGHKQGFRRKIPLTNTQNKSEEEVMQAVKFFLRENELTYSL